MNDHTETVKHVVDALSVGTAIATVLNWLPGIAALFTIVWTGIRIYESYTVQKFLKRRRK